jgi:hypothetical protein
MAVTMRLYHGGMQEVRRPNLSRSRQKLDFGPGFYLTTIKEQAEDWARKKASDCLGFIEDYDADDEE